MELWMRVLAGRTVSENYTFPYGSAVRFEFGLPEATEVKFYLGNDEKVLLQEKAPFLRYEGACRVFGYTLKTDTVASEDGGLFFFHFEAETPHGRRYSVCDGVKPSLSDRFVNEFQLTVYCAHYAAPNWLDSGVFYHIFVDRFAKSGKSARRSDAIYQEDWENGILEYPKVVGQSYPNNTHFGGDLYGVTEKLPYLKDLGVTVLYLSPVASAFSNHKYDTGDYLTVDPTFGGEEALRELIAQAHGMGIRVILDGVFNHVGEDSVYFNRYGKYPSLGAYQSKESPYYPWFRFEQFPDVYECWWGIRNLPRTVKNDAFRSFICERVIPYYLGLGIDGYRLDVADELDSDFLEEIVAAIKSAKPDAAVIGEVWEDASNKIAYGERKKYLCGKQLDGVMNYPLRNGLLAFMRDGDASLLKEVTEVLYCHYPPDALAHTMNSIGTHDTERILTLLGGDPDYGEENAALATKRMTPEQRKKAIRTLQFGYPLFALLPGIPCIYYGDEAGLEGYHDPFNRLPFPWGKIDSALHDCVREWNLVRAREPLTAARGFALLDCPEGCFAFRRFAPQESGAQLIVCTNATDEVLEMTLPAPGLDVLTGTQVGTTCTVLPKSTRAWRIDGLSVCE